LRQLFPEVDSQLVDTVLIKDCDGDMAIAVKRVPQNLTSFSLQLNQLTGKPNFEDDQDIVEASGFSLTEKIGDLFGCGATCALAHCVSKDLAMGKGGVM
jgi:hypothetical protein